MTDTTVSSPVTLERDGGVATVRLNRPDAMNALDTATKEALLTTLREVAEDESVRCVVLTGSGRAFCVGQDLKEHVQQMQSDSFGLGSTVQEHYNPVVELLATMDKPVIAAVNGVAAGAGASFAFATDLRILAASAGFNMAFTGIALSCDSGASYHLPRLIGTARAKELLLRPRTVKAEEALSLGLASEVVADEEFEAHVREVAQTLAAGPTKAYGAVRRAVAFSAGHTLSESLAHEGELMNSTGATADHRAAVAAFLAKEKPVFEGR
ncbi:enoyl-CoA hydratase/isomerase family protein [Ornithinimicrobium cavernae]|uniref:enoyl-CoA hydratase/isomerase family protein n=1 Tax=Ornithinimicrobium cavernae TaxID=2666047 RepID=UPI000D69A4F7|nr:enoyl-CoA hydratase-related protein [Ornithinimicrobium cavernae]